MNKKVFAIIGNHKGDTNKYKFLGTGFFIDDNGFFVTAGHVFRNSVNSTDQFSICFPEEKGLVPMFAITEYRYISKRIYGERERNFNVERQREDFQCGVEYSDVAVGKVDISEIEFYKFKVKRPFPREKFSMPCFNRNKKECPENEFLLIRGKINSRYIEFHEYNLHLKERLRLARIPYLSDEMKFEKIDLYNNCIELYGEGNLGNSGAPVLNGDERVIGIYVAGADFKGLRAVHLARYLKKKSTMLKNQIIKQ